MHQGTKATRFCLTGLHLQNGIIIIFHEWLTLAHFSHSSFTMDFKPIISGRSKIQILDKGFRLKLNKGPKGPMNTSYFTCVESGCKAKAATIGELTLEGLSLKFHRVEQHNHHSDVSKNIVADKLHEFRQRAIKNPDKTAKSVYDQLAAEAINSVGTPDKPHLASRLPKFRSVKDQHYRQRKKLRPNLPKTIDEVNISAYDDMTKTDRGHAFYRGKTPSAVELFMSEAQIDIAASSDSLFLDGTFAICPEPFYQVVFLRCKVGENRYTVGTAFLPNKRETTYLLGKI